MTENPTLSQTSTGCRVRIEVEPNSVVQTSPEIFAEELNTFKIR